MATSFFHVLNRGVDKRKVFMNTSDYARFVHDMWEFNDERQADNNLSRSLTTLANTITGHTDTDHSQMRDVRRPSFERKLLVKIHFFCLMPNHYHLLVSPVGDDVGKLSLFMKKLNGGYSKYFNEKYERSGALWQGKYKAVPIQTDAHFLYIPFYIHFNALDLFAPEWRTRSPVRPKQAEDFLKGYRWSSHQDYVGKKNFPSVTDRAFFLEHFGGEAGYTREVRTMLGGFDAHSVSDITLE